MNIFDLSPEELSALSLAISIGLAKQYTNNDQLGILAAFFDTIGDTLGLIQVQRITLAVKAEKTENSNSNESDS